MEKTNYKSNTTELLTTKIKCKAIVCKNIKGLSTTPNSGFIQVGRDKNKQFLKYLYFFKSTDFEPIKQINVTISNDFF